MNTTRITIVSLVGAALLVTLVVTPSFWAFMQIDEAAAARKQTYEVTGRAEAFLSALTAAETGQRGYLLTGDEAFLEPYLAVRDSVRGQLADLRQITLDSAAHKRMDALVPLVDAKMAELAQGIELRRNSDRTAVQAAVSGGQGRRLMDSIRTEMMGVTQIEEGALAQRDALFQSNMRYFIGLIVTASLFTLLFALLFSYLTLRETQRRVNRLQVSEAKLAVSLSSIGDVTEHKRAEEALLKAGALQAAIFNSANFSSIATDAKGVIQIFNVGAERMLGYAAADVMNKITPADISDPQEVIARAKALSVELGTPITPGFEALVFKASRGIEDIYELTYIRKDGSRFPAVVSVTALRDDQGAIIGYLLIGTDNSARKQVEAEQMKLDQRLRDQQFYTRSLIESNIDAIMTTDPAGIITDVNKQMEALTGCTRDELIGAPFKNYFTDPARAEAAIKLVLREKKVSNYELTARARDGKTTVVSYNATTFYDRDRKLQGVCAVARDVTERKRLDQALQEKNLEFERATAAAEKANLAKSDFLSSMSHELRSPLNAILGFAQLMESASPAPTESQKESIAQILQAGWHLLKLINEILDLAMIESGKLSLSPETVSLAEVMSECQAMMEPQAQHRGIKVTFPRFGAPLFVRADRTRLKQIVINLLSNAIKYNKEQGTVVIECTLSAPGRTRISVKDTGPGMPPEKLAQLFQPFNRLGQEAGAVAGTGIGLVVTKRLVELMEGTIGVESTVGEGSVFWCELIASAAPRLAAEQGETAVSKASPMPAPGGALQRTVLYIEDNPANMKLVEQLVERCPNIRLLTAVNGTLGVELARSAHPNAILMDINLSGISGIQALKILREDPSTARIPVVAVSANAMPRDIALALKAGFFRYLTKPIKVKEFMDTLNAALEQADKDKT